MQLCSACRNRWVAARVRVEDNFQSDVLEVEADDVTEGMLA